MQLPEEGANKLSRREMMNMLLRLKVDTRTSNSSKMIRLCKYQEMIRVGTKSLSFQFK